MRLCYEWDLKLQGKGDVLATVEVDVQDDDAAAAACVEALRQVLEVFGQAARQPRATIYVYQGPSINFGRMTNSIFFAVAGRSGLVQAAYGALAAVPGTHVRYGDYVHEGKCLPCLHVEDGVVWQSDGEEQWIA